MPFPSFRVTLQLQPELIVVKHDDVEPHFSFTFSFSLLFKMFYFFPNFLSVSFFVSAGLSPAFPTAPPLGSRGLTLGTACPLSVVHSEHCVGIVPVTEAVIQ